VLLEDFCPVFLVEYAEFEKGDHLLHDSRNEFDFAGMNHNLKIDSTWLIKIAKLEEYIRIVNFLSSRFKFGKGQNTVQNYKSKWTGSLTGDNYQSSHIRFETINFIYNYAILNFNIAMDELKDSTRIKDAIRHLRAAKWGMAES